MTVYLNYTTNLTSSQGLVYRHEDNHAKVAELIHIRVGRFIVPKEKYMRIHVSVFLCGLVKK